MMSFFGKLFASVVIGITSIFGGHYSIQPAASSPIPYTDATTSAITSTVTTRGTLARSPLPTSSDSASKVTNTLSSQASDAPTSPIQSPASLPESYYSTSYTVVCAGAITSFDECKPILANELLFKLIPATGVVISTHPDLPNIPAVVQDNCSIINSQNWSCTDSQGNKDGFADGQPFSDAQNILNSNPQRTTTFLNVTYDEYMASSVLLGAQIESQQ